MFNIISHYTEENFVKLGNVFFKIVWQLNIKNTFTT